MSQEYAQKATNERTESQYEEYLMPIWKELNVPIKRVDGCTV
jgi:4-aminobutyrate aminotransferase/4-aminobutyrate aminotransferase/(S)-3-amino-2-methylpropionate transaminase